MHPPHVFDSGNLCSSPCAVLRDFEGEHFRTSGMISAEARAIQTFFTSAQLGIHAHTLHIKCDIVTNLQLAKPRQYWVEQAVQSASHPYPVMGMGVPTPIFTTGNKWFVLWSPYAAAAPLILRIGLAS
jgi:hypothetical protein